MTENKPITNIIFDDLNQRIKNIGEKCLNFQEENKNLKEQLARKTQECEDLKSLLRKLCKTLLGTIHNCDTKKQKIERIMEYFKNKDISQTSLFNINCIEQDILQIIDEVE